MYYKKLHLYNINLLYIIIYINKASGSFYLIISTHWKSQVFSYFLQFSC